MESEFCECLGATAPAPGVPYVERSCATCGKPAFAEAQRPDRGKGLRLNLNEPLVIPVASTDFSLNATHSKLKFFRSGLGVIVRELLYAGAEPNTADIKTALDSYRSEADAVIAASPLFEGLDRTSPEDGAKARATVGGNFTLLEYWALNLAELTVRYRKLLDENAPPETVMLAGVQLANAHAMLVYLRDIDEVTWTGHRVTELQRLLANWRQNETNDKEAFWQATLSDNSFALSQVFALPVVILQERAYLGGKDIRNSHGRITDFLVANELTENVGIVEIKTPTTLLLATEYRDGVYPPSSEIAGAITQVLRQKDTLLKELHGRRGSGDISFHAFEPECVVIAGTYVREVHDLHTRASFELFRANLRHVRLVTYDELFRKIEALLRLFEISSEGAG